MYMGDKEIDSVWLAKGYSNPNPISLIYHITDRIII